MKGKPQKRAFTLIELLIVVAIIAILAAIAVPNFLEAQARAGVSRIMSDMRNVGIAVTLYRADHNQWPNFNVDFSHPWPGQTQIGWIMKVPGDTGIFTDSTDEYLGKLFTTPVAYLSSIPMDEFNSRIPAGYAFYCGDNQRCSFVMTNWAFDMTFRLNIWYAHQFFLESAGPDGMWWTEPLYGCRQSHKFHYDPTNGALSQGQIVYTDRGFISPNVSGLPYYPIN